MGLKMAITKEKSSINKTKCVSVDNDGEAGMHFWETFESQI